ncbi:MAG: 3-isopropylmalate dehydrogenase, partial [Lachnospiraceae bacterium]|nr:3-isopropylmalate dehydrogenase [Lachnospiraceae bacterium]
YEKRENDHLHASVMDLIVRANNAIFKEAKDMCMCKALEELMADELEAKRAEGIRLGIAEGKAENVLELLGDCGKIPDELRKRILYERNLDVLVRWLKLAARAGSVEEFQNAM